MKDMKTLERHSLASILNSTASRMSQWVRDEDVEELEKLTQWQPIATAPKDGKLVLLFGRHYIKTGYYDDTPQIGNYPNWRWGLTIEPTHWMPLPPAPDVAIKTIRRIR